MQITIVTSEFFFFHSIQLTNAVIEDVALVLSVITDRDTEVQPSSPRNPFDASSRARLVQAVREIIELVRSVSYHISMWYTSNQTNIYVSIHIHHLVYFSNYSICSTVVFRHLRARQRCTDE